MRQLKECTILLDYARQATRDAVRYAKENNVLADMELGLACSYYDEVFYRIRERVHPRRRTGRLVKTTSLT